MDLEEFKILLRNLTETQITECTISHPTILALGLVGRDLEASMLQVAEVGGPHLEDKREHWDEYHVILKILAAETKPVEPTPEGYPGKWIEDLEGYVWADTVPSLEGEAGSPADVAGDRKKMAKFVVNLSPLQSYSQASSDMAWVSLFYSILFSQLKPMVKDPAR